MIELLTSEELVIAPSSGCTEGEREISVDKETGSTYSNEMLAAVMVYILFFQNGVYKQGKINMNVNSKVENKPR